MTMSQNLSKKITEVLKNATVANTKQKRTIVTRKPASKFELYTEDVDTLIRGRKLTELMNDPTDLDESNFDGISNETIRVFSENAGIDYTGRKSTIQVLFEQRKINRDTLALLREEQEISNVEDKISNVIQNVKETEDDFISKFGEDIDFRNFDGNILHFDDTSSVYDQLIKLSEEDWVEYQEELKEVGIVCDYDSVEDQFTITNKKDEIGDYLNKEEERYDIEEEYCNLLTKIAEGKKFKVIKIQGAPKKTQKDYIIELVVGKDGENTLICYDDTNTTAPWTINNHLFKLLQDALESISIPYQKLYRAPVEEVCFKEGSSFLEKVEKKYNNKTDNLPLLESERRDIKSKHLNAKINKNNKQGVKVNILDKLEKGKIIKTNLYEGKIRHIDWLSGTVNIDVLVEGTEVKMIERDIPFENIKQID